MERQSLSKKYQKKIMAKAKTEEKKSLLEIAAELNKKYSGEREGQFFISTGSIGLDKNLGGGMQSSRITELIAWEGVGKTTICLHAVADCHRKGKEAVYIDSEHALDESYARSLGVDWDRLKPFLFQPDYGEAAFDIAERLLKTGDIGLLIFDSTSGMIPKSQFEGEPGESSMGKHARLFSAELPKINSFTFRGNCVTVFVSQVREKIGVMFGSPETTQAGNALKFNASNRIELRRTLTTEDKQVVRQKTRYKVLKCKNNPPFGTGEFTIEFGEGIDRIREIQELSVEKGIIKQSGSWFSYEGNKLGQGEDNVIQLLKDNEELLQEIEGRLKDKPIITYDNNTDTGDSDNLVSGAA